MTIHVLFIYFNHGDHWKTWIYLFQWQFLCSVPITAITTTILSIQEGDSTVTTTMTTITTTITTRHIGKQDFRDTCTCIYVWCIYVISILFITSYEDTNIYISPFQRAIQKKNHLHRCNGIFFPVSELNIDGTMNSCIYIISEIGLYRIFNVNYIHEIYNKNQMMLYNLFENIHSRTQKTFVVNDSWCTVFDKYQLSQIVISYISHQHTEYSSLGSKLMRVFVKNKSI